MQSAYSTFYVTSTSSLINVVFLPLAYQHLMYCSHHLHIWQLFCTPSYTILVPASTHILRNFANPSPEACDCDLDRVTGRVTDEDAGCCEVTGVVQEGVGAVLALGTG